MSAVSQVFVFVFGAVIGSFLNAVAWRLRTRESFIRGRSYCPWCRHELSVADLVPIVSYIFLCGRCRYCRKTISPHYPAVEAVTGLLFLLAALRVAGAGDLPAALLPQLLLSWYLLAVLVLVFVYDLKYMLVLRTLTLTAAVIAFLGSFALGGGWLSPLVGAAVGGGFFWLQHAVSRGRWVGGGDLYLGILVGAMVGWPLVLLALFLAYVSGAIVGVGLIAFRRKTLKSQVPFGTFLAVAAAVTLLYGNRILFWYLSLAS